MLPERAWLLPTHNPITPYFYMSNTTSHLPFMFGRQPLDNQRCVKGPNVEKYALSLEHLVLSNFVS